MIVSVVLNVALFLVVLFFAREYAEDEAEISRLKKDITVCELSSGVYRSMVSNLEEQMHRQQKIIDGIAEAQKRAAEGTEDEMRGGAEYF